MRQEKFRKCSICHRFSEIFQLVINRRINKNSRIFLLKTILNIILRMENIRQISHKHTIREMYNCDMTKALEQDF